MQRNLLLPPIALPTAPDYEPRRHSYPQFFNNTHNPNINVQVFINNSPQSPSPLPAQRLAPIKEEEEKAKTCCERFSTCCAGFIRKLACG